MCPVDKVGVDIKNYPLLLLVYIDTDDADANLDDSAGQLIFLARTCVQVRYHSIIHFVEIMSPILWRSMPVTAAAQVSRLGLQ